MSQEKIDKRKAEKMLNDLIYKYYEVDLSLKNEDVKFTNYCHSRENVRRKKYEIK